jgi:NitT/TauT family transport system permease protein
LFFDWLSLTISRFFLISIESFELGNRDFRLPGLGSYLAAAAEVGNYSAILAGLLTIIAIIVAVDFLVWRPLIAWSSKFKYGGGGSSIDTPRSLVLNIVTRSRLARSLISSVLLPAWEAFISLELPRLSFVQILPPTMRSNLNPKSSSSSAPLSGAAGSTELGDGRIGKSVGVIKMVARLVQLTLYTIFGLGVGTGIWRAIIVMRGITTAQWLSLCFAAVCTFGRVFAALSLSLLWTVPVGIAIGRNPALAARMQPIVQIAASTPATALFPFVLIFLAKLGGGLQIGSIALMMLGTMWYVLFNVIAGAQAIPSELFDVDLVYNRGGGWVRRWRTLVLPGIFPYLITGIVTAVGGAWNASIVSEYVVFRGGVMKTHGLGSLISEAAATGNYPLLLAGTVVMSVLVLLTNRFVWGPLYRLAESKYRI